VIYGAEVARKSDISIINMLAVSACRYVKVQTVEADADIKD